MNENIINLLVEQNKKIIRNLRLKYDELDNATGSYTATVDVINELRKDVDKLLKQLTGISIALINFGSVSFPNNQWRLISKYSDEYKYYLYAVGHTDYDDYGVWTVVGED